MSPATASRVRRLHIAMRVGTSVFQRRNWMMSRFHLQRTVFPLYNVMPIVRLLLNKQ